MSLKRIATIAAGALVGIVLTGPTAMATYSSWGTLYAYEGSTLVAEGRGTAGVDFNLDVIGGHIRSYDPRPGGSPAYGEIGWNYVQPSFRGANRVRGANNYTASWIDRFVTANLDTTYTQAELWGKACQDDKLGPDACRQSQDFNQKW
jgi:hypothetical protein